MMNQLKPFLKKFLLVYAFAVTMVLIYFVTKTLFTNTKEVERKSFNKPTDTRPKAISENKDTMENTEEKTSLKGFILLPDK